MQDQEQIQENIQAQTQETEQFTQPFPESVQVPVREESNEPPTFLKGYEISNFKLSPNFYKILAVATVFNLLFIFAFAQGNLLTRKGCESPFVRTVCGVLDTVYVATMVYDTDSQYVVKEYDKTEIGDAEEITYIDVSGETPPLTYPAGYFALANPEQYIQSPDGTFTNLNVPQTIDTYPSGSITPTMPSTSPDIMDMPQKLPPINRNPVIGSIADSPIRRSRKNSTLDNDSPAKLPDFDDDVADKDTKEDKDKKPDKKKNEEKEPEINSDAVTAVEINKKPFEDFSTMVLAKMSGDPKPDLTKPFMVVMQGAIKEDGTLDRNPKKTGFIKESGDQEMINLAKSAIEAVGDSGVLGYLRNLDIDNVNFTLVQDEDEIFAIITSKLPTPERANSKATSFNNLIQVAFFADANGIKKLGDDEKLLLKNAKASSDKKNFVLKFKMPKKEAHEMIQRNLEKEKEKRKQEANSTAQKTGANQKTGK